MQRNHDYPGDRTCVDATASFRRTRSTGPGPRSRAPHILSFFACATAAATLGGCDPKLDGPTLRIDTASPNVVCAGKADAAITLNGAGFSPVPLGALSGTVQLAFPRVEIRPVADLAGTPIDNGTAIRVSDDAGDPAKQHVHFLSDSQLAFDLADLGLKPGLYGVSVTSPQTPNVQTTTLDKAFVILPAPKLASVAPASACTAGINQTITLKGEGFVSLGEPKACAADGDCKAGKCTGGKCILDVRPRVQLKDGGGAVVKEYAPLFITTCIDVAGAAGTQSCNEMSFNIEKGDVTDGAYTVAIVNPAPVDCASAGQMFTAAPAPTVTRVSPATVCATGGVLTITGTNFVKGARASLGGQATTMPTTFVNATTLRADFSGNTYQPGMTYELVVENGDGCSGKLGTKVSAVGGPTLFFIDPPVVSTAVATPLSIYTTAIMGAPKTVTLLKSGGMTAIDAKGAADPAHAGRVLATAQAGLTAGDYDVTVTDGSGCPAVYRSALKVAGGATVMGTTVTPAAGSTKTATRITIKTNGGLAATPRVYLLPKGGARPIELASVSFVSATEVSAVVPAGLDAAPGVNPYGVAVVNADGSAGVAAAAYTVTAQNAPRVDAVVPGAIAEGNPPPSLTITGADFRKSTVTISCSNNKMAANLMPTSVTADTITLDSPALLGAMVVSGVTCTVRVTNDDGSTADYASIAITNANGQPLAGKPGPDLGTARRAPGLAVAGNAAGRWLYAAGGDNGMAGAPLDTVESVAVSGTGLGAAWTAQASKLGKKRTLAGLVGLGRYLYLVGGNDGGGAVTTVERAAVLDPAKAPTVADIDLKPGAGKGPGAGVWFYRIAAIMGMNDADNPGGESLASPSTVVRVPNVMGGVIVVLGVGKVQGATGYRIYRTPAADGGAGKEVLIDTVGDVTSWTDDGTKTPDMTKAPLGLGSTGAWSAIASLKTAREAPALALAPDPAVAGTLYIYAIGGRDNGMPAVALNTYEFLPITVAADGAQTLGTWTAGSKSFGAARAQAVAFVATADQNPNVKSPRPFIYVAGGTDGMASVTSIESATVGMGGDLGAFTSIAATLDANGAIGFAGANNLIAAGGLAMGSPANAVSAAPIGAGNPPVIGNFTPAMQPLVSKRYLPGGVVSGPLLILVGGADASPTTATKSTEWMVY